MGQEVEADQLGDEFKGYVFKITGGNDKDGFPMRQGVMVKVDILIFGHFCQLPLPSILNNFCKSEYI